MCSQPAPPTERALVPGLVIARKFALLREIASGGMGSVFVATDMRLNRKVAIKLLQPQIAHLPHIKRRFLREAQATARIRHPNVVAVHDLGASRDGTLFIVQELLEGENIREHVTRCGAMTLDQALDVALPVMSALDAAHRVGIVHRDVKPDNIVLARMSDGSCLPKLLDFGVAKAPMIAEGRPTGHGQQVGTPAYMAPEQARGDRGVDGRADMWAITVVLLEMLNNRMVFPGPADAVTFVQILNNAADHIAKATERLPSEVRDVIVRAMAPGVAQRYPNMPAYQQALQQACGRSYGTPEPVIEVPEALPSWMGGEDIDALPPGDDGPELQGAGRQGAGMDEMAGGDDQPISAAGEAVQALEMNALEEATERAQRVLDDAETEGGLRARMLLVQAIAQLWLGDHEACCEAARGAMADFEAGSTAWYVALGHFASAVGAGGDSEQLDDVLELLVEYEPSDEAVDAHAIASCRAAVTLLRKGRRDEAESLLETVESFASAGADDLVLAWRAVVRSTLAAQLGDASAYLSHVGHAVEYFTVKGDIRNACHQRLNLGDALMQLGAYARAERTLREVVAVADPMRLVLASPARVNLGFTLARRGKLERAYEVVQKGLEQAAAHGLKRFEAVGNGYLAVVLSSSGKLEEAEQAAQRGVEHAQAFPSLLACAHAILGGILLMQERNDDALSSSRVAMDLLTELGAVEEGEALIRLVHATSLAATGQADLAHDTIVEARRRLRERARCIADRAWRRSFLSNVPENAQTLTLAQAWARERSGGRKKSRRVALTMLGLGDRRN